MPSAEKARLGQYIGVDPTEHPDLAGQRLLIIEVLGTGDDAMYAVRGDQGLVTGLGGRLVRYIRADEALPAPAMPGDRPRVTDEKKETVHMNAETKQLNLATTIARTEGISLRDATFKANRQLTDDESDEIRGGSLAPAPRAAATALNLTDRPGIQRLRAETQRVASRDGVSFEEAADRALCEHLPDAGATRFARRVQQLRAGGLDHVAALMTAQREDPTGAEAYRLAGL
ncbi:MAG TPA: hypothetical protein VJN96_12980 [Vicinamibacterales bacterium]|nr:hypothetical protein [Vicinamibacterales bacterium]